MTGKEIMGNLQEFQKFLDAIERNSRGGDSVRLQPPLSEEEYYEALRMIIDGEVNANLAAAFLEALNVSGFNANLFCAAAKLLRQRADSIKAPKGAVDVCGTGGDRLDTLNISTAVGFVVAGCGVPVAKHGNKAVSSKSGSADVLSELGVDIMADKTQIETCLARNGLCFMFAPLYHSALKNVAQIRKDLGRRTIFNFMGPLLNPAKTSYQLIGVSDEREMMNMAQGLQKIGGFEHIWLACGSDGMDEITITGKSKIIAVRRKERDPSKSFNPNHSASQHGHPVPQDSHPALVAGSQEDCTNNESAAQDPVMRRGDSVGRGDSAGLGESAGRGDSVLRDDSGGRDDGGRGHGGGIGQGGGALQDDGAGHGDGALHSDDVYDIEEFEIDPQEFGIRTASLEDIKGGDAKYNARRIRELLEGKDEGAYCDIVALNAAAALVIARKVNNISSGLKTARDSIKNGEAKKILENLF